MRGAWIETITSQVPLDIKLRRAPCGARGLKRAHILTVLSDGTSRPVRGAWIDMLIQHARGKPLRCSKRFRKTLVMKKLLIVVLTSYA